MAKITEKLKMIFQVPSLTQLTVIAGSLLLLAWSIDALITKDIETNLRALSEAEMANTTVQFQTTILDSIGHLDQNFELFIRQYAEKEDEHFSKWKLKSLADQQIPVDMLKRQIGALSLRASLYQAAFSNVGLSTKTHDLLYDSASSIFHIQQDMDNCRLSYQQSIRTIANTSLAAKPSAEPSEEQINRMREAGDKYFSDISIAFRNVPTLAGKLQQGYNQALEEVNAQLIKKKSISGIFQKIYIVVFALGSLISLYTGFKKG
jgi:hypothetical protein